MRSEKCTQSCKLTAWKKLIFRNPKKVPNTLKNVSTALIFLFSVLSGSRLGKNSKKIETTGKFQKCPKNIPQSAKTCFEHILNWFFRKRNRPGYYGGSRFGKIPKCSKTFPKVIKHVLNMFSGDFFGEFFCPVYYGWSIFEKKTEFENFLIFQIFRKTRNVVSSECKHDWTKIKISMKAETSEWVSSHWRQMIRKAIRDRTPFWGYDWLYSLFCVHYLTTGCSNRSEIFLKNNELSCLSYMTIYLSSHLRKKCFFLFWLLLFGVLFANFVTQWLFILFLISVLFVRTVRLLAIKHITLLELSHCLSQFVI